MLPPERRLRRSTEFTEVVRRGSRGSRPLLTIHLLAASQPAEAGPSRAGLVISKAVGNAVVRHRTARRLRHLLRSRLDAVPAGSRLVVRAAPRAGSAGSPALAADLDAALVSAARSAARPRRRS